MIGVIIIVGILIIILVLISIWIVSIGISRLIHRLCRCSISVLLLLQLGLRLGERLLR